MERREGWLPRARGAALPPSAERQFCRDSTRAEGRCRSAVADGTEAPKLGARGARGAAETGGQLPAELQL